MSKRRSCPLHPLPTPPVAAAAASGAMDPKPKRAKHSQLTINSAAAAAAPPAVSSELAVLRTLVKGAFPAAQAELEKCTKRQLLQMLIDAEDKPTRAASASASASSAHEGSAEFKQPEAGAASSAATRMEDAVSADAAASAEPVSDAEDTSAWLPPPRYRLQPAFRLSNGGGDKATQDRIMQLAPRSYDKWTNEEKFWALDLFQKRSLWKMDSKDPLMGAASCLIRRMQTWGDHERRVEDLLL